MKRSTALLKEPIIYSWSSVNILQNNYLCILQKKESHKGLKQHESILGTTSLQIDCFSLEPISAFK